MRSNFISPHPERLFSFSLPNSTHLSITHLSSIFSSMSFVSLVYSYTFLHGFMVYAFCRFPGTQTNDFGIVYAGHYTTVPVDSFQSSFLIARALFQITVSVAQSRVRSPSPSNKPRYRSYAFTQAAYVKTPEQQRKFLTSKVGCLMYSHPSFLYPYIH